MGHEVFFALSRDSRYQFAEALHRVIILCYYNKLHYFIYFQNGGVVQTDSKLFSSEKIVQT